MAAALQFEHISKEYRSFFGGHRTCALDDFTLAVEQGEIFGFLGPNGAGKTTAIHLAMGFMRPTGGSGRMLERPFGDAATRRRVGFLAENVALYHRPVRPLIRFYGALNGMSDPELGKRTREMLELLELEDVESRNASKLSRGMLQRVGLAQALVNDPDLLILDEPTSALDPLGRVAVRELLLRSRNAGKTIFLSSHLLSEIELISDRIAILHKGKLRRVGRTIDLLESAEQSEIVARNVSGDAFAAAALRDGYLIFTIDRADLRSTIERVWSLGGEVVKVNPLKRSLEDIFIELTSQEEPKE